MNREREQERVRSGAHRQRTEETLAVGGFAVILAVGGVLILLTMGPGPAALGAIIIVAAFGITCTTITFVVMKTREIGLLKAIGATSRQVMWVFMGQSLIVSAFGIAGGVGSGLTLISYRNQFLDFMRRLTGWQLFPVDIYGFSQLPALIVPRDIVIICGGSLPVRLGRAGLSARVARPPAPRGGRRYD